ncbi:MAG: hypothetical protein M3Z05_06075 [Gemmatimonadota bacterium]|nr:hypothetical protein [Gemmatimonadota bacterium]
MTCTITRRLLALPVFWLALVVGCASNGNKVGMRPEQLGAYRFTEHVGEDMELEGIFVIESDTVSIEATPGLCRYDRDRSNALAISYICGDVFYTFDRTDPLRTARYSAVVHLRELVSTCVRYAVTSTGRQVCAETRKETVFRDARRSGLLRPQRMADDDPNRP